MAEDINEKLITKCPVCESSKIKQNIKIGTLWFIQRDGSYCETCGVKFIYNHISDEEFRKNQSKSQG